jgi:hypothetical protein
MQTVWLFAQQKKLESDQEHYSSIDVVEGGKKLMEVASSRGFDKFDSNFFSHAFVQQNVGGGGAHHAIYP